MAISGDGQMYFASDSLKVRTSSAIRIEIKPFVKNVKTGDTIKTFEWDTSEWRVPTDAIFSPNGKTLLVLHDANGKGGAKLFDLYTGEMIFNVRHDLLQLAVFTPNSRGILSASGTLGESSNLWLWDVATRKKTIINGPIHARKSIAVSPNGKFIAAIGHTVRSVVFVGNAASGDKVCELPGDMKDFNAVALSSDSKIVAAGDSDGVVRLWSIPSGKPITEYDDHQAYVASVAFHPKQKLLASAGRDGTIKLFDYARKRLSRQRSWRSLITI